MGAFEAGQLFARQWTHRTRLVVGLWHGLCASPTGAHEAMRRGIMACRANLGLTGGGYHRTRTEFFLKMIGAFAIAAPRELNLVSLANALLASALTRTDLADAFYTPARLSSTAARDTWLEPDLRALAWPALVGGITARRPTLCAEAA